MVVLGAFAGREQLTPLLGRAAGLLLASGLARLLYRWFKIRSLFRGLKAQGIVGCMIEILVCFFLTLLFPARICGSWAVPGGPGRLSLAAGAGAHWLWG